MGLVLLSAFIYVSVLWLFVGFISYAHRRAIEEGEETIDIWAERKPLLKAGLLGFIYLYRGHFGAKKFKFIVLNNTVYPRGKKSLDCPRPLIQVGTMELERTLKQIKKMSQFYKYRFCWENCDLECPAKEQLLK